MKTSKIEKLLMPVEGEMIKIEKIPHPKVAAKELGFGFGIVPTGNVIFAPYDGEITYVSPNKNELFLYDYDLETRFYIGIGTDKFQGNGFKVFVKEGSQVKAGDPIAQFNLRLINEEADSNIVSVLFSNTAKYQYHIEYGTHKSRKTIVHIHGFIPYL